MVLRFYVSGLYGQKRGGKWTVEPLRAEAQVDGECGKAWRPLLINQAVACSGSL